MNQQQELAALARSALERKNLSINAASIRFNVDRQVLTRLAHGIAPRLDVLERIAVALGEDLNRWRQLASYEPLEPAGPGWEAVRAAAAEAQAAVAAAGIELDSAIPTFHGGANSHTTEYIIATIRAMRDALLKQAGDRER